MIGGRPSWSIARCLMTGSRVWRQLAVRGASNRLGSAELTRTQSSFVSRSRESPDRARSTRVASSTPEVVPPSALGIASCSARTLTPFGPRSARGFSQRRPGSKPLKSPGCGDHPWPTEIIESWRSSIWAICAVENREQHFRRLLAGSLLFESAAQEPFVSPLSERASTPSVEAEAWRARIVAIGERAVALDPLSSSGVEQAMRLGPARSDCRKHRAGLPGGRRFRQELLCGTAARIGSKSRRHDGRSLPPSLAEARHRFWQDRSSIPTPVAGSDTNEIEFRLAQLIERSQTERSKPVNDRPAPRLSDTVHLSPLIQFVSTPCVENDRVISRLAVTHATLPRPAAYVCGIELVPLLKRIPSACPVGNLITSWSETFPRGPRSRFSNG